MKISDHLDYVVFFILGIGFGMYLSLILIGVL
jgi:hypothetical protein